MVGRLGDTVDTVSTHLLLQRANTRVTLTKSNSVCSSLQENFRTVPCEEALRVVSSSVT